VSDYALDGLKQMMAVKSRVVLPYLVPQVTTTYCFNISPIVVVPQDSTIHCSVF